MVHSYHRQQALKDLTALLTPHRPNERALPFDGNDLLRCCLKMMESFLHLYVTHEELGWIKASIQATDAHHYGAAMAKTIRQWTWSFLKGQHDLPHKPLWPIVSITSLEGGPHKGAERVLTGYW